MIEYRPDGSVYTTASALPSYIEAEVVPLTVENAIDVFFLLALNAPRLGYESRVRLRQAAVMSLTWTAAAVSGRNVVQLPTTNLTHSPYDNSSVRNVDEALPADFSWQPHTLGPANQTPHFVAGSRIVSNCCVAQTSPSISRSSLALDLGSKSIEQTMVRNSVLRSSNEDNSVRKTDMAHLPRPSRRSIRPRSRAKLRRFNAGKGGLAPKQ